MFPVQCSLTVTKIMTSFNPGMFILFIFHRNDIYCRRLLVLRMTGMGEGEGSRNIV